MVYSMVKQDYTVRLSDSTERLGAAAPALASNDYALYYFSSYGRGRQGRCDSARCPASIPRVAGIQLHPSAAELKHDFFARRHASRAGQDRHFQSLLLRGSPCRPRSPEILRRRHHLIFMTPNPWKGARIDLRPRSTSSQWHAIIKFFLHLSKEETRRFLIASTSLSGSSVSLSRNEILGSVHEPMRPASAQPAPGLTMVSSRHDKKNAASSFTGY